MRALLFLALLLPGSAFATSPDGISAPGVTVTDLANQMIEAQRDEARLQKIFPRFQEALLETARQAEGAPEAKARVLYDQIDQAISDLRTVFPHSPSLEEVSAFHGRQLSYISQQERAGLITLETAVERTDFSIYHYNRLTSRLLGRPSPHPDLGGGCLRSYMDCIQAAQESFDDCLGMGVPWGECHPTYLDVIAECADDRDACAGG